MNTSLAKTLGWIACIALLVLLLGWQSRQGTASRTIQLHGASQLGDDHSYTQALKKFAELVETYYKGDQKVEFVLHKNSELGTEKDYFGFMNIGAVVDYAVIAPSHASTFSRMVTIMDVPFLFRDTEHFLRSLDADVFQRAQADVEKRADVMILGYGGGEKRHFFGRRPVRNLEELKGFDMRVMGAPIQSRVFSAVGASPSVISMSEIYNAIQTGVIDGAENSAAILKYYKYYEVAPEVSLAAVSIIVRPLMFSGKRFRQLPADLQAAIRRAGREAMVFERELEIAIDDPLMQELEREGKITLHDFSERDKLLDRAEPVKEAFAKEIGALDILEKINALAVKKALEEAP